MKTITSKDGTTIAFDQSGTGPALILVGGALEQRVLDTATAQLARLPLLAQHFTIFHYDRRGRGDSTDTQPYAVEREIEDIEALINEAGGKAFVFGISSGAALAMEAAIELGNKIEKLAMYEAPYNSDEAARQAWIVYRKELNELVAAGRAGDAVGLFMMLTGMPAEHLPGMRRHPMWPMFEAVGLTLAYDAAAMGDDASVPIERAARVAVPALVMDGGASYPFMHVAAVALANAMPYGQHRTLEGQGHEVDVDVLAPVLVEFFGQK
jgi:pimeloyl-ACP methyl ester carboxylesterase